MEKTLHIKKFPVLENEKLLISMAADGDREAYGKLYTYYYGYLFNSLVFISKSREDTEEIIHDVFLKVWKTRENLTMIRSFKDYIYTIARNQLFDLLKRNKIKSRAMKFVANNVEQEKNNTPEQELVFQQYHAAALEAINSLSDKKKEILILRTRDGLSLHEIAAKMHISHAAVKKHLYTAIKLIKIHLQRNAGWAVLAIFWNIFLK